MTRLLPALFVVLAGCSANPYMPETMTAAGASSLSDTKLCVAWYQSDHQPDHPALAEIRRRGLLTERELETAARSSIYIGMSEIAMYCAWGQPYSAHSSNYGDGVQWQYVFCRAAYCASAQYVYVQRGVVTAWN